jgi:hypothetical protein
MKRASWEKSMPLEYAIWVRESRKSSRPWPLSQVLADRRDLVHELGVVGAALVDGVDAGARHSADLALQL